VSPLSYSFCSTRDDSQQRKKKWVTFPNIGKEVNYITKLFKELEIGIYYTTTIIIIAEFSVRIRRAAQNPNFKIAVSASFSVHIVTINT
jgi:hypothetical protein